MNLERSNTLHTIQLHLLDVLIKNSGLVISFGFVQQNQGVDCGGLFSDIAVFLFYWVC
jgi:hypothetical protein